MMQDLDTTLDSALGARIEHARIERAMSVEQLARKLGVEAATVQSWESGQSEPRANRIVMIAGVLSVSMRWLITGENGEGGEHAENVVDIITRRLDQIRRLQTDLGHVIDELDSEIGSLRALQR